MDLVTMAYVSTVLFIMLLAPGRPADWWPHLFTHLGLLIAVALMKYLPQHPAVRLLRDWYAIPLQALLYGELRFVNQLIATGFYDAWLIPIESKLFGGTQPAVFFRALLPNRIFSEYVHASYFIYLLIPVFGALVFTIQRRRDDFWLFLTTILMTFFSCYVIFILFPVAGPYYTFPRPDPGAMGYLFPRITRFVTESGASKGAAFPSSHVAVAVAAGTILHRLDRKLFWIVLPVVVGIALGVVYGGFHYAVDAVVGIVVGWVIARISPRIVARLRAAAGQPAV